MLASELMEEWALQCSDDTPSVIGVLLYGSWNAKVRRRLRDSSSESIRFLQEALGIATASADVKFSAHAVEVDSCDESQSICIDNLKAPEELPAIVLLKGQADQARAVQVPYSQSELTLLMDPRSEQTELKRELGSSVANAWSSLMKTSSSSHKSPMAREREEKPQTQEQAVRLFVAGDRSKVGKSSVCLGLLGCLLNSGYAPNELAYIKPATQCEETQLIEEYCKSKGVSACVPVGPIVYYKGFTRAFLKGETESSDELLKRAGEAVDDLAKGKRVVIVDGVGYPAVGSITGTDNASVAKACGRLNGAHGRIPVPVLLVGKSGVGDAIDSYNINATYFAHSNVPVIGAVFNKLSIDGYYSLANCKEAIEAYFDRNSTSTAFGFIPIIPSLSNVREELGASPEEKVKSALAAADLFVDDFAKRVNVSLIVKAAREASDNGSAPAQVSRKRSANDDTPQVTTKVRKVESESKSTMPTISRAQIEALAKSQGAASG